VNRRAFFRKISKFNPKAHLLPGKFVTCSAAKAKQLSAVGGFILEAMPVAQRLVRRTQSSTSSGTERSVTSLAIC
jgi:hypothetical protein